MKKAQLEICQENRVTREEAGRIQKNKERLLEIKML